MKNATFLLTFDTELLWGNRAMASNKQAVNTVRKTKDLVMPSLLLMLDDLQIPATFAVVGHLLRKPGEYYRPRFRNQHQFVTQWYDGIAPDYQRAPEGFYWPEITDMIRAQSVKHEIALHGFSHWYFPSEYTTEDIARFEVQENIRSLKAEGVSEPTSMVFPRNGIGHLATLVDNGINAYRSLENAWYNKLGGPFRRGGHLLDAALGLCPPVHKSVREPVSGLLEIPGSALFMSATKLRRLVPAQGPIRQIREGCNAAIRANGIFHLWTHPMNLGTSPTKLLEVFRRGLATVSDLVVESKIRVLTMSELARTIREVGQRQSVNW